VTDFDDARVRGAMRAFLRAADELDEAAASSSSDAPREIMDKADAKTLAEMTLRKNLENAGWVAPREVSRRTG
jgi:hypothetical protein